MSQIFHRALSRVTVAVIVIGFVVSLSPRSGGAPIENRPAEVDEARPNILIIVTDDQRGGLRVMPHTRRIFRDEGVTFSNAFATTPVCCPSRASIFTGRYAHNHNVKSNRWRSGASQFDPQGSLPHLLRTGGYRTGVVGKYFNAWPLEQAPYNFDEFVITKGKPYYGGWWNRNGYVEWDESYSTSVIAEAAVDFVTKGTLGQDPGEAQSPPWFLHIGTVAPHAPFTPEKKYERVDVGTWAPNPAHDDAADWGKPLFVRNRDVTFEEGAAVRQAQLRTLKSVDDLVGRLFDVLDETDQSRDTLAFFVSDNGMLLGEYGLINKGFPYTPSVQVPMMMRWPARLGGRSVDERLVGNIDVAPTVLEAVGLPAPLGYAMDGRSLLDPGWERTRILLEFWRNARDIRPWASIRSEGWQYIEHFDPDEEVVTFRELYDLRRDPWQLRNLLTEDRELEGVDVEELEQLLERDRACRGTVGPERCP